MEVPATVLDILKCSMCTAYLSRSPVYLQHDGAAICGRCYTPKHSATRDKYYEATAKLMKFPCKYRELGCPETVPFADEEVIAHEEVCEYRQYVCPVLGSACDWLGTRAAMLTHFRNRHPDHILENPCSLTHDISKSSLNNYILSAFQLLFLLHTKVCVATGKIYHSVRYLGTSEKAANYFFNLDIRRNNEQVSKEGQVASQDNLEDMSVAVNSNNLLGILGGFDGTTFTVTVKRRVSDADMKTCAVCGAEVTVFRYRDGNGWQCERCAPDRRFCRLHDCSHIDTERKCEKHEMFFCQQRTKCYICDAVVPRGSWATHYGDVHQDISCRAGSTWRATQAGRFRLVASAVGTVVCQYVLNDAQFELDVHVPVANERLREFCCEVRVTDPTTRHTRTYTPAADYDKDYDWRIQVQKLKFPSWSGELDVIVKINKMPS